MGQWGWALLVVGLLVLAWWRPRRASTRLQYLFFCRFPVLLSLILVGLAVAAAGAGLPTITNLFWLLPHEILLVSWLSTLAAWEVMITTELTLRYAPERFDAARIRLPVWVLRYRVLLSLLLALPVIGVALAESSSRLARPPYHGWEGWAAAAGGILLAGLCLLLSAVIYTVLYDPQAPAEDILIPGNKRLFAKLPGLHRRRVRKRAASPNRNGLAARLCRALPGYFDPKRLRLRPGHVLALAFLVITLGIYLLGYFILEPGDPAMPALASLLFVLILLGWALPALGFFVDRFRTPVLLLLLVAAAFSSQISDTDYYYPILRTVPQDRMEPAMAFAVAERSHRQRDHPVVVVAASGGGITASLWTATVLTSLQAEAGPDFAPSIRFLSTVSGGSVGAMYFLDRFPGQRAPAADIQKAAGEPSLDSVAWGMAYPDIWRLFLAYVLPHKTEDRGWAMEQSWKRHMRRGDATLADWRREVHAGRLPAFAFNSTVSETGEQFLFTSLDLFCRPPEIRRPECWQARSFFRAYSQDGRDPDLAVTTAVRMSASFPWVTPIARAMGPDSEPASPRLHLADGGYYDNFGVVTAVNWLQAILPAHREELRRRGVLLVLIRAFPQKDTVDPKGEGAGGWFYTTVGPLSTIYNVRTASQAVRNDTDLSLLKQSLAGSGVRLESIPFELEKESPLSWKLTDREREEIQAGWRTQRNQAQLQEFKRLFGHSH